MSTVIDITLICIYRDGVSISTPYKDRVIDRQSWKKRGIEREREREREKIRNVHIFFILWMFYYCTVYIQITRMLWRSTLCSVTIDEQVVRRNSFVSIHLYVRHILQVSDFLPHSRTSFRQLSIDGAK